MIRGAGRVAAVAAIAALAGAAWLALLYGRSPALTLEFNTTAPAAIVRGIYTAERDDASGRTFAWTTDRATIRLDDLDRQVAWSLDLTVRGARAGGAPNPELQVFADGVHLQTIATTVDFADARIADSAAADREPPDARAAIVVDVRARAGRHARSWVSCSTGSRSRRTASRCRRAPRSPGSPLASAAAAAGVAALGVTAGSAIGAALVISAGLAALVAHGFGPYTDFASVAARTSLWIVLVGAVLIGTARAIRKAAVPADGEVRDCLLRRRAAAQAPRAAAPEHADRRRALPRAPLPRGARRTLVLHVDRARQLPVPVRARPLRRRDPVRGTRRRGAADMTLLRTIVCIADALAGLLLYAMASRVRGDRLAGAIAVAIYHLIPLGFGVHRRRQPDQRFRSVDLDRGAGADCEPGAPPRAAAHGRGAGRDAGGRVRVAHERLRDRRRRRLPDRRLLLVARRTGAALAGGGRARGDTGAPPWWRWRSTTRTFSTPIAPS